MFESVADYASWSSQTYTVARADGPQVFSGVNVSPEFFSVFRVRPALGRAFSADDMNVEQPAVCILRPPARGASSTADATSSARRWRSLKGRSPSWG